jgi:hypothetical protein
MYPEHSPYAFLAPQVAAETFNALFFVEKTTAARKNPPATGTAEGSRQTVAFAKGASDAAGSTEYRDPELAVSLKLTGGWKPGEAFRRTDQRQRGFMLAPGSVARRPVGGKPGLTCVADFTDPASGDRMVKYLTWVNGDEATALFFARAPNIELDALRQRLDPIIETLKLP